MKFKKLIIGCGIVLGSLLPVKSQAEDFYVSTQKEFETALDYTSSTLSNIYLADGEYNVVEEELNNTRIVGETSPVPKTPIVLGMLQPPLKAPIINGTFVMEDNTSLENLVLQGDERIRVIMRNNHPNPRLTSCTLRNIYFNESEDNKYTRIVMRAYAVDSVSVENCIISTPLMDGIALSYALTTGTIQLRNNVFYRCQTGFFARDSFNADLKDNAFVMNENNFDVYLPPKVQDWTLNYWTDKDGKPVLTEQDILATGIVRSPSPSPLRTTMSNSYNLDVIPCSKRPFYYRPAKANKTWMMYY